MEQTEEEIEAIEDMPLCPKCRGYFFVFNQRGRIIQCRLCKGDGVITWAEYWSYLAFVNL